MSWRNEAENKTPKSKYSGNSVINHQLLLMLIIRYSMLCCSLKTNEMYQYIHTHIYIYMFNTQILEFNTDSGSVFLCTISIQISFQLFCLLLVRGETEDGRETKISTVNQNCSQQYNIFLTALSTIALNYLYDNNSINSWTHKIFLEISTIFNKY